MRQSEIIAETFEQFREESRTGILSPLGFLKSRDSNSSAHAAGSLLHNISNATALIQTKAAVYLAPITGSKPGDTVVVILVCVVLNWLIGLWKVRIDDTPVQKEKSEAPAEEHEDDPEEHPEFHGHPLLYLSVGRVKDKTELLHHTTMEDAHDKELVKEMETDAKKLLVVCHGGKKFTPGVKDKLIATNFRMYYHLDKKAEFLICLAVHDAKYPEKYAYQCMTEMISHVHEEKTAKTCHKGDLTKQMHVMIEELFSKFEKPWKNTAMGKLLEKTGDIGAHVSDAASQVQENAHHLDKLEEDTEGMKESAESLNATSAIAKWKHQVEAYKFYMRVCVFLSGTASVLVIWIL